MVTDFRLRTLAQFVLLDGDLAEVELAEAMLVRLADHGDLCPVEAEQGRSVGVHSPTDADSNRAGPRFE